MNGEPLRRTFKVTNPNGLHMRPISAFVETALKFPCDIHVALAGKSRANGKSVLELMGLAAEQGSELIVEVAGPDAPQVMSALLEVLEKTPVEE